MKQHLPKFEMKTQNRKQISKNTIIRCLSKSREPLSIQEITEIVQMSIPNVTEILRVLVEEKAVIKEGKKKGENGRRPYTYVLHREQFYVIGVEILSRFVQVSVLQTDLKVVKEISNRTFVLNYSFQNLEMLSSLIKQVITASKIEDKSIIGIGIGILDSHRLFLKADGEETSLKKHIEELFNIPVFVDDDTRTITVAEQTLGIAKGLENTLVVKVSRLIGIGMIVGRDIVLGSGGYAGNFAHTQFEKGTRLCFCGKMGCLGTAVGGNALSVDMKEALLRGEKSLYFSFSDKIDTYNYHDILEAVKKGDELSINLLHKQGIILGKALGNLINILNPELVVLSGEFTMVEEIFINALKLGLQQTTLPKSLKNCNIRPSSLGRYLSSKAGGCLALKSVDMIKY